MKTIRANAEKILTDNMNHVNAQIDVQASANNGKNINQEQKVKSIFPKPQKPNP